MQELANKVATNYGVLTGNKEAAFDISFLYVIMDIIEAVIESLQNCQKTPPDALNMVKGPSRWEKVALRVMVRRQLGFVANRRHGDDVVAALLKTGGELTVEELEKAMLR